MKRKTEKEVTEDVWNQTSLNVTVGDGPRIATTSMGTGSFSWNADYGKDPSKSRVGHLVDLIIDHSSIVDSLKSKTFIKSTIDRSSDQLTINNRLDPKEGQPYIGI